MCDANAQAALLLNGSEGSGKFDVDKCDANAQAALLLNGSEGSGKFDVDKELVQLVTVICGTLIAVAALIFDGDLGYAMGTGILTMAGTFGGYIFGVKKCEVNE